ncbi:hypothetical protein MKZ38_010509 [Zalerion maritima]|uniref:Uncharacterized protein n=1 Tax=Zalerion maritima TaxID=339359 RepID=A0AAD5RFW5_9PEZI|nr:hypothetical protein MKZ38_010509 [Zalerion maritima]
MASIFDDVERAGNQPGRQATGGFLQRQDYLNPGQAHDAQNITQILPEGTTRIVVGLDYGTTHTGRWQQLDGHVLLEPSHFLTRIFRSCADGGVSRHARSKEGRLNRGFALKSLDLIKALSPSDVALPAGAEIPYHLTHITCDIISDFMYNVASEWHSHLSRPSSSALEEVSVDLMVTQAVNRSDEAIDSDPDSHPTWV